MNLQDTTLATAKDEIQARQYPALNQPTTWPGNLLPRPRLLTLRRPPGAYPPRSASGRWQGRPPPLLAVDRHPRASPPVSPISCTNCSASLTTPVNSWQNGGTRRTIGCQPEGSQGQRGGNDRQLLTTAVICWQDGSWSGPRASSVRHSAWEADIVAPHRLVSPAGAKDLRIAYPRVPAAAGRTPTARGVFLAPPTPERPGERLEGELRWATGHGSTG
jgi:hypothetical protein